MAEQKSPLKWKFKTGDWISSSPNVSEGVVYFGSNDKHLYALDIKTGEEQWKFKTGGSFIMYSFFKSINLTIFNV